MLGARIDFLVNSCTSSFSFEKLGSNFVHRHPWRHGSGLRIDVLVNSCTSSLYESVSKYALDFETLSTSVLGIAQNCPLTQTSLVFCTPPSLVAQKFASKDGRGIKAPRCLRQQTRVDHRTRMYDGQRLEHDGNRRLPVSCSFGVKNS